MTDKEIDYDNKEKEETTDKPEPSEEDNGKGNDSKTNELVERLEQENERMERNIQEAKVSGLAEAGVKTTPKPEMTDEEYAYAGLDGKLVLTEDGQI